MLFILCLPLQNHCIHRLASLGERPLREHGRLLAPCGHNWTSECRSLSTTHVESVSRAHCLIYLPSTAIPQITLKMASTTTTVDACYSSSEFHFIANDTPNRLRVCLPC